MRVTGDPETSPQSASSGWESLIWPRWLPLQARLPLIAQIAGAMALVAAVAMPRLQIRSGQVGRPDIAARSSRRAGIRGACRRPCRTCTAPEPVRPAHLNLDVRHSLRERRPLSHGGREVGTRDQAGRAAANASAWSANAPNAASRERSTWPPACASSASACDPRRTSSIRHAWSGSISIRHRWRRCGSPQISPAFRSWPTVRQAPVPSGASGGSRLRSLRCLRRPVQLPATQAAQRPQRGASRAVGAGGQRPRGTVSITALGADRHGRLRRLCGHRFPGPGVPAYPQGIDLRAGRRGERPSA